MRWNRHCCTRRRISVLYHTTGNFERGEASQDHGQAGPVDLPRRGRALEKIQFLSNQDAGAREDEAELEMKEMMGIEKDMGEERAEG